MMLVVNNESIVNTWYSAISDYSIHYLLQSTEYYINTILKNLLLFQYHISTQYKQLQKINTNSILYSKISNKVNTNPILNISCLVLTYYWLTWYRKLCSSDRNYQLMCRLSAFFYSFSSKTLKIINLRKLFFLILPTKLYALIFHQRLLNAL